MIYLLRERGIRASGEGGNPLTDSAAVLHALSILRLADHPDDSLACFHVATSPLGSALELTVDTNRERRYTIASDVRARLAKEGYGPFLAGFLRGLDQTEYGDWDKKRFSQLVDLAFSWDARASLRPGDFVEFVTSEKVEDPSSAQVKVMTIHGSKGLEFDAVVLPELDLDPFRPPNAILTDRPLPDGPITAVSRSAQRDLMEADDQLARLWASNVDRTVTEFLCLLYVAMTRAVHRLDLIVQKPTARESRALSFARILRAALGDGEPDENGLVWEHEESEAPWFSAPKEESTAALDLDPFEEKRPELAPSGDLRALPRRSPSAQEGGSVVKGRQLLLPRASRAADRGTLIHRWLSEVEWLEDFALSDDELVKIGLTVDPNPESVEQALIEFRALFERPNLCALLKRQESAQVWREREFSVILKGESSDELWTGAFDRVVLTESSARIIDFKTDRVEESDLGEKVAFYEPQLAGYARVLAQLTGRSLESIDSTLAFLHLDETVEL